MWHIMATIKRVVITEDDQLVYMFRKGLGDNAVNIYGFHIQVLCHNYLHKLVHLLYKARKILEADKKNQY